MIRAGKLSPLLLASVAANLALAGWVGYSVFGGKRVPGGSTIGRGGGSESPNSNAAGGGGAVESLGRIQPAGGVISVYGPPGDRVKELLVAAGAVVQAGDKLAGLTGDDDLKLQLNTLDAQIKESESLKTAIRASRDAKLADIDAEARLAVAGNEQDSKALDAKVRAVDAQKAKADADLKRMTSVQKEGVPVSEQEFETVRAVIATADAERAVALAQKEKLLALKDQSAESIKAKKAALAAETDRALAQVPSESLAASKAVADKRVKDAGVHAPTAGRVVRLSAKVGDTLSNQPVLQLADTSKLVVIAEVYETDVGRLREWVTKKGPVKVEIDARVMSGGTDEKKLSGRLVGADKVASLISRNVLTPLGPREDADRRVVEVEVELDKDSAKVAENFLGLQVRTRFLPPQ